MLMSEIYSSKEDGQFLHKWGTDVLVAKVLAAPSSVGLNETWSNQNAFVLREIQRSPTRFPFLVRGKTAVLLLQEACMMMEWNRTWREKLVWDTLGAHGHTQVLPGANVRHINLLFSAWSWGGTGIRSQTHFLWRLLCINCKGNSWGGEERKQSTKTLLLEVTLRERFKDEKLPFY